VQGAEHHETKGVRDGLDFDPFAKIPSGARVEEVSRGKKTGNFLDVYRSELYGIREKDKSK